MDLPVIAVIMRLPEMLVDSRKTTSIVPTRITFPQRARLFLDDMQRQVEHLVIRVGGGKRSKEIRRSLRCGAARVGEGQNGRPQDRGAEGARTHQTHGSDGGAAAECRCDRSARGKAQALSAQNRSHETKKPQSGRRRPKRDSGRLRVGVRCRDLRRFVREASQRAN
jgi:hypothetical protein